LSGHSLHFMKSYILYQKYRTKLVAIIRFNHTTLEIIKDLAPPVVSVDVVKISAESGAVVCAAVEVMLR